MRMFLLVSAKSLSDTVDKYHSCAIRQKVIYLLRTLSSFLSRRMHSTHFVRYLVSLLNIFKNRVLIVIYFYPNRCRRRVRWYLKNVTIWPFSNYRFHVESAGWRGEHTQSPLARAADVTQLCANLFPWRSLLTFDPWVWGLFGACGDRDGPLQSERASPSPEGNKKKRKKAVINLPEDHLNK